MKERNYWQQFLSSGKIADYLSFKDAQEKTAVSGTATCNVPDDSTAMGDNPYAGICKTNRNGFEDSAYRGIR
ncbi:MAG: hypothetical protein GX235_04045 [Clostridiales bacterium]|nr:hypothetical protein [Clostridiales bacterium]